MNIDDMIKKITERMKKADLVIFSIDNDNKLIYSKLFLMQLQENPDQLVLYFSVSTRPDDAALISLFFKEMRDFTGIGKIKIGESYYSISMTKILWGDEAYTEYDNDIKEINIKETKYDSLMDDDDACFHC